MDAGEKNRNILYSHHQRNYNQQNQYNKRNVKHTSPPCGVSRKIFLFHYVV